MRNVLLQSLPRSFVTQLTGLVHEPACSASAIGTRHVVQQARSLADAQPEHRAAQDDDATSEPEGSTDTSAGSKAMGVGKWAAQGAQSVARSAKNAVTGTDEAQENHSPAGAMQQRRTVGQDDDSHERISGIRDTVKDKWQDERPISERFPAMGKAASKQHRTGGPDSDKQHGSRDQDVHTDPHT